METITLPGGNTIEVVKTDIKAKTGDCSTLTRIYIENWISFDKPFQIDIHIEDGRIPAMMFEAGYDITPECDVKIDFGYNSATFPSTIFTKDNPLLFCVLQGYMFPFHNDIIFSCGEVDCKAVAIGNTTRKEYIKKFSPTDYIEYLHKLNNPPARR